LPSDQIFSIQFPGDKGGSLGLMIDTTSGDVKVSAIDGGGLAEQEGVRKYDVLLQVERTSMKGKTVPEVAKELRGHRTGHNIRVYFYRGKKKPPLNEDGSYDLADAIAASKIHSLIPNPDSPNSEISFREKMEQFQPDSNPFEEGVQEIITKQTKGPSNSQDRDDEKKSRSSNRSPARRSEKEDRPARAGSRNRSGSRA